MTRLSLHRVTSLIASLLCVAPLSVSASPSFDSVLQVIDLESRTVESEASLLAGEKKLGFDVAVGDFGGDGVVEYVVVQSGGADAVGRVSTHRLDGSVIAKVTLPGVTAGERLSVAAGDIDGDTKAEIIISQPDGPTSDILILNATLQADAETAKRFVAFPELTGGASVTTGNVLGDAREEILVGTGPGSFPLLRIFDESGTMLAPDISPFGEGDTEGISAAAVNTTGGQHDDIVVGRLSGADTTIKTYQIDASRTYPILGSTRVWSREFTSGVNLTGADTDGDGLEEIAVTPAGDQRAEVQFMRADGQPAAAASLALFSDDFRGGASLVTAQLDTDPATELVVVPQHQRPRGDTERTGKWIEVNLSEQIEYVWEDGYLRNVYLISSGLPGTPTPVGDFSITKKLASHHYVGEGYNFPNTPWNLRFVEGGAGRNVYLHTAYWHNNFGRPMSHGCVNMRQADAEWLFHWADIGTPVWTHY